MSQKQSAYIGRSRLPRKAYPAFQLLMYAIEIAARDDATLWKNVPAGELDRAYLRRLGETLLAKTRIESAARVREELRKFANQIEAGRGRHSAHGYHPEFAKKLAASVRELAKWLRPPQQQGRGGANKGQFDYPRTLAEEALAAWTEAALARNRPEIAAWFREPGSGRRLGAGRGFLVEKMLKHAAKHRRELSEYEAKTALRDAIKAAERSR